VALEPSVTPREFKRQDAVVVGDGAWATAEPGFAGRPKFFGVEGNEPAGTQPVMVIFLFLAPGTCDTSPGQIKSQGVWKLGHARAQQPHV